MALRGTRTWKDSSWSRTTVRVEFGGAERAGHGLEVVLDRLGHDGGVLDPAQVGGRGGDGLWVCVHWNWRVGRLSVGVDSFFPNQGGRRWVVGVHIYRFGKVGYAPPYPRAPPPPCPAPRASRPCHPLVRRAAARSHAPPARCRPAAAAPSAACVCTHTHTWLRWTCKKTDRPTTHQLPAKTVNTSTHLPSVRSRSSICRRSASAACSTSGSSWLASTAGSPLASNPSVAAAAAAPARIGGWRRGVEEHHAPR